MKTILRLLAAFGFCAVAYTAHAQFDDFTMGEILITPDGQRPALDLTPTDVDNLVNTGTTSRPEDPTSNPFELVFGTATDAAEHTTVEMIIEGAVDLLIDELVGGPDVPTDGDWVGDDGPTGGGGVC